MLQGTVKRFQEFLKTLQRYLDGFPDEVLVLSESFGVLVILQRCMQRFLCLLRSLKGFFK